jgi:hypothetical protein
MTTDQSRTLTLVSFVKKTASLTLLVVAVAVVAVLPKQPSAALLAVVVG